jgi:ribosomal protein L11 methylase PrmA
MLDIGCNVGVFSVALAKHLRAASLLGIDIDVSNHSIFLYMY